jgi:hypothetical protein
MEDKRTFRILTEKEKNALNFEKDFIKVSFDFSAELGVAQLSVNEFLKFLEKKILLFDNTDIGNILYKTHKLLEFQYQNDGESVVPPILLACNGPCGGCGCTGSGDNCQVVCGGFPPSCGGACGCFICS